MTVTADGNRRLLNRTGSAVAGALVCILAGALYAVMQHEIPEKNHDIVLMLMNTVSNAVIGIVGYFFGASVGNARQGEIIATQAQTAQKLAEVSAAAAGPAAAALAMALMLGSTTVL